MEDKQLFQIQNILETLIEATDHFNELIKKRELNQSVYIFSSIVEGAQAIANSLYAAKGSIHSELEKLEKHLVTIAEQLENRHFTKVSEIVQFAFRPLLVRMNHSFLEEMGNQRKDGKITIGIFHSAANPKDFMPKERLKATLLEGRKQNTILYFFTSADIQFKDQTIEADTWIDNEWKRVVVPFPDVINNVGGGKRSQTERKLQRMIPFTGFHVGNKFTLPKRMVENRKYAELLVPFTVCLNEEIITRFMLKNNHVVFKALKSNRGENIYFVNKKGSRFIMVDQKKERIMNMEKFQQFITDVILAEKGSYIIQRYIHTRTKADEPYHFRSHMQKNNQGEWQITHIYPRIGSKKSHLSNISTEGRVDNFSTFLVAEYGNKQGMKYEKEILALSIDVVTHLDKLYGMGLNELGLDFAIDDRGKVWMHEANNGPQTAYHEEKRAIHYIGYAKYIAQNGIMHTSLTDIKETAKGQFKAKNAALPLAEREDTSIGVLLGKRPDSNESLPFALALQASEWNIPLYLFTPKDIDYNLGLIRGSFLVEGKWVDKITEYPTVIIDRLKMRSMKENHIVYEELEDIPFTNDWVLDATSRSTVYALLQKGEKLANWMADYQVVHRPLHVFQLLEQYGQVQLKQENMSELNPSYIIIMRDEHQYEVLQREKSRLYDKGELRHLINHLLEDKQYLVQEYIAMKEAHVHMMKDAQDEWYTVSNYVQIGMVKDDKQIRWNSTSWATYLNEYNSNNQIKKLIESGSLQTAKILDKGMNMELSEIAFTYTLGVGDNIRLIEANLAGPRKIYDEEKFATAMIKYATSIIKKTEV